MLKRSEKAVQFLKDIIERAGRDQTITNNSSFLMSSFIQDNPSEGAEKLKHHKGDVKDPPFNWFPPVKTIQQKEKRKFILDREILESSAIPPDIRDVDLESLKRQKTVHVEFKFDWKAALDAVKTDAERFNDLLEQQEKAKLNKVSPLNFLKFLLYLIDFT